MPEYLRIAVNVPSVAGVFDYGLPESLTGRISPGHLVLVPFGDRTAQGVVLSPIEQPAVPETKDVLELLDSQPVLTSAQIALAEEMAQSNLAPLAALVELFLPPGINQQVDTLYEISSASAAARPQKPLIESRLLDLLQKRGPLRARQIDRNLGPAEWRRTAQALVKRGALTARSVLPPASVRPKFVRTAQLAVAPEIAQAALAELGTTEATRRRRQAALLFLIRVRDAVNVSWVYAESGCTLADLQELAERELISLGETQIWRDPLQDIEALPGDAPALTHKQQAAWEAIASGFDSLASGRPAGPFLLEGVTGSGKTEIYLRAAEEAVRRGKQAIVLVPEISLTPQTVRRFLGRFPGQVGLVHSKLSDGERYDTWRRARAGLLNVVIGPRSALFAPLKDIGLIVADECHDGSYYQAQPPFYHAVTAARSYARICGAVCLMGSATPSIVQRYQAEIGQTSRLTLGRRLASDKESPFQEMDLPAVQVVDMRVELKEGNRSIFSRSLIDSLAGVLEHGEQAILFLNRRGTATQVFCRDCGYVLKCPRCDNPLTLHTLPLDDSKPALRSGLAPKTLMCHHCGYRREMPEQCPNCGGVHIGAFGLGSEKVEADLQALFPKVRTLRWDWGTTRQRDAHEIILTHFAAGRADVLVGTQMLAKGLELPGVTLVGIVLADVGLHLPDPFAAERVFQVLTQVAGRAGRSKRGGRVVLQTFSPEHYVIQAAALHDIESFYVRELEIRKTLGYPPFARLVRLEFRHREAGRAEAEANELAQKIAAWVAAGGHGQISMIGPVPCFFAKVNGEYRWQIVLRGPDPAALLRAHAGRGAVIGLPDGWRVETEPISLL
jgi:primosomal protein N' (replication factor Y)